MRGSWRTERTSGWPRPSRRCRRVGSPRGTGFDLHTDITAGNQIAVERRHRRQATPDGRVRQPRAAIGDPHHILRTSARSALRVHEPEHVSSANLDRILGDDREERLQVMCIGAHRVRPRPTRRELQELIDEWMPDDVHVGIGAIARHSTNLRRPDHENPPCPSSARREVPQAGRPGGGSPV